jgi:hypothetical protein
MGGILRRAGVAAVSLVALMGTGHAANFYVEYAVLVDLAHNFCRGYFPSDPVATQSILDRNKALGFQFMGQAAFEAELPLVRSARLVDSNHMDTQAWCEKTRREIVAHGDGAMFPAIPPPRS